MDISVIWRLLGAVYPRHKHVCQSAHLSPLQLLTVSEQLHLYITIQPLINFCLVFVFIFSSLQTSERQTKAASSWDDWEVPRLQTRTCHFTGIVSFNDNYRKYKLPCSGKGTADELHQSCFVVGSILLGTVFSVGWWHSPVMSFCQVSGPKILLEFFSCFISFFRPCSLLECCVCEMVKSSCFPIKSKQCL